MSSTSIHEKIPYSKIFISTREEGESYELIKYFSNVGAEVLELPMIKTSAVEPTERDKTVLEGIRTFEWIVFTSANGVKYFFNYFENQNLQHLKFAAIGNKTALKLQEYGYKQHYIGKGTNSKRFSTELQGLFKESKPNVLFPTGNLARRILEDNLVNVAHVWRVIMYKTKAPDTIDSDIIDQIAKDNYNILFFYSPSAVNNFYNALKDKLDFQKLRAACIGPTTEKACINKGITPIFTSQKQDTKSMFDTTMKYLKNINQ